MKRESPVIISASRRTDMPNMRLIELLDLLTKGELTWQNPFNASQKKVITTEQARLFVFWSKNPSPLFKQLHLFKKFNYYFQYTLNDYPDDIEPGLPKLNDRIDLFKKIVDHTGIKNISWRFDPIVITDSILVDNIYESINNIAEKLKGYTDRLTVSFMQPYKKALNRFKKAGLLMKEIEDKDKIKILTEVGRIVLKNDMELMTCSELLNTNNELQSKGIRKGKCIDPDYIRTLFIKDEKLMDYLSSIRKDSGQRKECGCINSTDIGRYHTCTQKCLYCYAC